MKKLLLVLLLASPTFALEGALLGKCLKEELRFLDPKDGFDVEEIKERKEKCHKQTALEFRNRFNKKAGPPFITGEQLKECAEYMKIISNHPIFNFSLEASEQLPGKAYTKKELLQAEIDGCKDRSVADWNDQEKQRKINIKRMKK